MKLLKLDISIANKEVATTRNQNIIIRLSNFNIIQAIQPDLPFLLEKKRKKNQT